jgi:hypothetical protein
MLLRMTAFWVRNFSDAEPGKDANACTFYALKQIVRTGPAGTMLELDDDVVCERIWGAVSPISLREEPRESPSAIGCC